MIRFLNKSMEKCSSFITPVISLPVYLTAATIFLIIHPTKAMMTHRVELNSTVSTNGVTYSGQVLVFTCITRDSLILEWYSDVYIGTGGDRLQLLAVNCVGSNITGTTQGTSATCLRVTDSEENNETVIISQLLVRASVQIPASTVTCNNNGHGFNESITFQTTVLPNENVTLTSTLKDGDVAYPQQKLVFTCITRNSLILEWNSDEYIGDKLRLLSVNCVGANVTSDITDASATCLSVFDVNGTVIVSELHVTASLQYPQSTVSCINNDLGSRRNVSFQTFEVTDEHNETNTHNETDVGPQTTENTVHLTTSMVAVPADGSDLSNMHEKRREPGSDDTELVQMSKSVKISVFLTTILLLCMYILYHVDMPTKLCLHEN